MNFYILSLNVLSMMITLKSNMTFRLEFSLTLLDHS